MAKLVEVGASLDPAVYELVPLRGVIETLGVGYKDAYLTIIGNGYYLALLERMEQIWKTK